jgi:large exoprotein involved in heme utilization and adhesion
MMLIDSRMSAEAGQDGGNIEVHSPRTLVLQRSDLSANAIHGKGGYISIAADGYLPSRESVVSASSEFGLEGCIEIDTPETDVGSGLVILPDGLISTDANIAERCALRLSGGVSSFFLNGNGGLPAAASENYLPAILADGEEE